MVAPAEEGAVPGGEQSIQGEPRHCCALLQTRGNGDSEEGDAKGTKAVERGSNWRSAVPLRRRNRRKDGERVLRRRREEEEPAEDLTRRRRGLWKAQDGGSGRGDMMCGVRDTDKQT